MYYVLEKLGATKSRYQITGEQRDLGTTDGDAKPIAK